MQSKYVQVVSWSGGFTSKLFHQHHHHELKRNWGVGNDDPICFIFAKYLSNHTLTFYHQLQPKNRQSDYYKGIFLDALASL